jgi:pimeloyl-ACP methyl ester carboxylesterase
VPAAPVHRFHGRDGLRLAYRELGEGRPLVLIHGFLATARLQWIDTGHAALLAERGHRVVMPDLRGHGDSAAPHDAAAYPKDVVTDDGFALVEQLGLTDYDLGGYSLGGRTTIRMLARGATPGRAIVAGMGLEGIVRTAGRERGDRFRHVLENVGSFAPGSPQWRAEAYMRSIGGDPVALRHMLEVSVDTQVETIARIQTPTLVVTGERDDHNDTAPDLAATLPHGRHVTIPGTHSTAPSMPELGAEIAEFLSHPATLGA